MLQLENEHEFACNGNENAYFLIGRSWPHVCWSVGPGRKHLNSYHLTWKGVYPHDVTPPNDWGDSWPSIPSRPSSHFVDNFNFNSNGSAYFPRSYLHHIHAKVYADPRILLHRCILGNIAQIDWRLDQDTHPSLKRWGNATVWALRNPEGYSSFPFPPHQKKSN